MHTSTFQPCSSLLTSSSTVAISLFPQQVSPLSSSSHLPSSLFWFLFFTQFAARELGVQRAGHPRFLPDRLAFQWSRNTHTRLAPSLDFLGSRADLWKQFDFIAYCSNSPIFVMLRARLRKSSPPFLSPVHRHIHFLTKFYFLPPLW